MTTTIKSPLVREETSLQAELDHVIAARFASDTRWADAVYVVMAALAAGVAWPWVSPLQIQVCLAGVGLTAICRAVLRRSAASTGDPHAMIRAIRSGVLYMALVWGVSVIMVGPELPGFALAWIVVIFCAILMSGAIALLADPFAFHLLTLGLQAPLLIAVLLSPAANAGKAGALIVAFIALIATVFVRNAHRGLVEQLHAVRRLTVAEHDASALRQTARQLAQVIEATPDSVVLATATGNITWANAAGHGLFAGRAVGGGSLIELWPPRLRDVFTSSVLPRLMRDRVWRGETFLRTGNGGEVPVSLVALVHDDDEGRPVTLSLTAHDITEANAIRAELARARDAAESATAAKSAFLANTSHEIRTPLNGIIGLVELLLDTDLTESQRRTATLIANAGESLLSTINDVLDFSKIEADQLLLDEHPFDLPAVVLGSVRLFSQAASVKGIELVTDVGETVPSFVRGDAHRLRQVLVNLVGNAIKFTDAGDIVITVRRAVAVADDAQPRVAISVRDAGIGIPGERLAAIFEPFQQASTSVARQYGGTGLGLSISRRLVELMGGELAVRSTPGQGSTFFFTLPFREEAVPDGGAILDLAPLRDVRVLVVDDHPANRRALGAALASVGCVVATAPNDVRALVLLHEAAFRLEQFGLVLVDVAMPGVDGFELVARIRATATLRDIPIVMLTANRQQDSSRGHLLQIAGYVEKPASRAELLEAALAVMAPVRPAAKAASTSRRISPTGSPRRVLLAEDNPVNQEVAGAMLRRRGHEVTMVSGGRDAVSAVRERGPFDVVLMDLHMPDIDGLLATAQIRLFDVKTPIVAFTANVAADDRAQCLAVGMNGFLGKPFRSHELLAMVERWNPRGTGATAHAPLLAPPDDRSHIPPVDLATLHRVLGEAGVESIQEELLRLFLAEAPGRVSSLMCEMQSRNAAGIATVAHAFRSGASSIHAEELARLLGLAELRAKAGDIDAALAQGAAAARECHRVMAYLSTRPAASPPC